MFFHPSISFYVDLRILYFQAQRRDTYFFKCINDLSIPGS